MFLRIRQDVIITVKTHQAVCHNVSRITTRVAHPIGVVHTQEELRHCGLYCIKETGNNVPLQRHTTQTEHILCPLHSFQVHSPQPLLRIVLLRVSANWQIAPFHHGLNQWPGYLGNLSLARLTKDWLQCLRVIHKGPQQGACLILCAGGIRNVRAEAPHLYLRLPCFGNVQPLKEAACHPTEELLCSPQHLWRRRPYRPNSVLYPGRRRGRNDCMLRQTKRWLAQQGDELEARHQGKIRRVNYQLPHCLHHNILVLLKNLLCVSGVCQQLVVNAHQPLRMNLDREPDAQKVVIRLLLSIRLWVDDFSDANESPFRSALRLLPTHPLRSPSGYGQGPLSQCPLCQIERLRENRSRAHNRLTRYRTGYTQCLQRRSRIELNELARRLSP